MKRIFVLGMEENLFDAGIANARYNKNRQQEIVNKNDNYMYMTC